MELKPLRKPKAKKQPRRAVEKDFRDHLADARYKTLTVPVEASDADEIRSFLTRTSSLWPQPYETRVAARVIEAVVMNLSPVEFIAAPAIYSPVHVLISRGKTTTLAIWVPNRLVTHITELKKQRPKLRAMSDTDAVALLLVEGVARYIRGASTESAMIPADPADVAALKAQIKILTETLNTQAVREDEYYVMAGRVRETENIGKGHKEAAERYKKEGEANKREILKLREDNDKLRNDIKRLTADNSHMIRLLQEPTVQDYLRRTGKL